MKKTYRVLGVYQTAGGACSLVTLGSVMLARGSDAFATLFLFSVLAVAAGVAMWRENPACWRLTIFNQLIQIVGLHLPWFSFKVMHGAAVTVLARYIAKATFADSTLNFSASLSLGSSKCDVRLLSPAATLPGYDLSLNFLALGVLIYVIYIRKKAG